MSDAVLTDAVLTDAVLPQGLASVFVGKPDEGCRIAVAKCDCDQEHFFPPRSYCPRCLEPMARKTVSGEGRIYAFTIVRRRAPFGLGEPYAIGYVDLAEVPLRVFGLFAPGSLTRLKVGAQVGLKVMPLGVDGEGKPCLRPAYEVVGEQHG